MTCEKPLTPLLSIKTELIAGLAKTEVFEVNNGLIMASKGSALMEQMVLELFKSFERENLVLQERI
jgi:hypothetical protein